MPMSESDNHKPDVLCPFQEQCALVEILREKMPELSQRIFQNYCTTASSQCARRQLYEQIGPRAVPPLMLPGQLNWACQIADELKASPDAGSEHAKTH
jgi:hypothetical protein